MEYGTAVAGLIIGGVVAAPPADYLTKILPTRPCLVAAMLEAAR